MVDRPDLDEFLGALNGFLEQKTVVAQDPSYHRFLEIFCRSVGSAEGHLLQLIGKNLQSIVNFGTPANFEKDFNTALMLPNRELCPLDSAIRDQQVLAVTELKRGSGAPEWFMSLAAKYKFKALVAVPLIGNSRAVGVLCAYYRDVCLFDRGTLDRLTTIGRMVGTAMDKNSSEPTEKSEGSDTATDTYLQLLTMRVSSKAHIFEALTKVLAKAFSPSGLVCGPIRVSNELVLTVADGTGVSPSVISQRVPLPAMLAQRLIMGQGGKRLEKSRVEEWGALKAFMAGKTVSGIAYPVVWQNQPQAAIVAWRSEQKPFTEGDEALISRLASVTALALRAIA